MRLKIISDGTLDGTNIVSAETGERVEFVSALEFTIGPGGRWAEARITMLAPLLDVTCEAQMATHDFDNPKHRCDFDFAESAQAWPPLTR